MTTDPPREPEPMCVDDDSIPPIPPIAGGALDSAGVTLTSEDGNRFRAFAARSATPTRAGIVILPDVRGLHPFYEELALRFAEHGVDAIAIDYFGRTAGLGPRGGDFEHMPHAEATTFAGQSADLRAAVAYLRSEEGGAARSIFTTGFCFGGRLTFLSSTLGLGLQGVIGFYGWPMGKSRNDMPPPAEMTDRMESPVLAIFGGADQGIPVEAVETFRRALADAGVEHEVITYPDAPHSFFDRKAEEFADASADAWTRVLGFIGSRSREEAA
jgi:carboxymethylenebutenolidase